MITSPFVVILAKAGIEDSQPGFNPHPLPHIPGQSVWQPVCRAEAAIIAS